MRQMRQCAQSYQAAGRAWPIEGPGYFLDVLMIPLRANTLDPGSHMGKLRAEHGIGLEKHANFRRITQLLCRVLTISTIATP